MSPRKTAAAPATRKRASAKSAPAPSPAGAEAAGSPRTPVPPLFTGRIGVRWRDLDAFNHVNNATYLTYLEESRLQWLRHVPGPWFDERSMPVLAASDVNYRLPIEWPAEVRVELHCERLGNSSLTLGHRIVDAGDPARLYSDGKVVLVWMDPATGKPVPLPQAIRDAVEDGPGTRAAQP